MKVLQEAWQQKVAAALSRLAGTAQTELGLPPVAGEIPPRAEMGDLAFPMFPFAKLFKKAPNFLAREVAELLDASSKEAFAMGAYVNVRFSRAEVAAQTLQSIRSSSEKWGCSQVLSGQRIMIEFSSPNTNKPLHLGHLRNNTLGESVSRLLKAVGASVHKVNLINDRGVHICKSMLAYQQFGNGETPESCGKKSDHFVGDYYVRFSQWLAENPEAEAKAQELLRLWEAQDPQTLELWKKMNSWAVNGILKTYARTGIHFDSIYYESQTYQLGREEILKGLEKGVFSRRPDGAVVIDLPWKNSPEDEVNAQKVLLRADGTSIYLTQDIGTAISRQKDWPFDQLIYVVANEQDYHFKVLFYVLERLGFSWAANLFHLSYGMVNLPEGRMKSREGTVVDADNLLDELRDGAVQEIQSKGRENAVEGLEATAENIALGALHYYLLQASPSKDMIFNPQESLSFAGNTGPYLQYTGARLSSMLAKARESTLTGNVDAALLSSQEEWELVKLLAVFPETVEKAALSRDPSVLAGFLYETAKSFSRFYHECPILSAPEANLVASRLALAEAVLVVLKNGFELLNIPFLRSM
jgi:arginyl-tRNA synthetase